jgi:hypothetical protein
MLAERAFGQLASAWSKMRVLYRWAAVNQSGGQSGPMSDPPPWHFTTWLDLLDHWQTLFAGVLAVLAAWRTIRATTKSADREVAASQAQTRATLQQTETSFALEQMRKESEASAFHVMLVAAMVRVRDEAALARTAYQELIVPQEMLEAIGAGRESGSSPKALAVRQCITKGAFAELRAACVRLGGDLTGDFLDLEREIDSFASQYEDRYHMQSVTIRMGKHAGLDEQLARIETKAGELLQKAVLRDKAAGRI